MGEIKLKIADLELDHDNPRISHAAGQQEALQKIVNDQKTKLVKLAQSIADYGLNPMDRFLALQKKIPNPSNQIAGACDMNLFRVVALTAGVIFLALACLWMFVPQLILCTWQIDSSEPALLVARRSAALFLGIGALLLLARNAEASPARRAIATGVAITCATHAAQAFLNSRQNMRALLYGRQ